MNPVWALFWFTVRQTILARKVILALMMLAGPSAIALLIRIFAPEGQGDGPSLVERYHFLLLNMMLGGVLPLVCMVYGPTLIGSEVEAGTIVYHFTRRMRRATVFVVRYLGTALAVTLLLVAGIVVCHLINVAGLPADKIAEYWTTSSPGSDLAHYLLATPLIVCAFLAVFATLNQVSAKGLIASGMYFVVVELTLANIPAKVSTYTVTHAVRKTIGALIPAARDVFMMPKETAEELYPPGESGWFVLLIVAAALVVACAVIVAKSELMPERAKRE